MRRCVLSRIVSVLLAVFMFAALMPCVGLSAAAATPKRTVIDLSDTDTIENIIQKVEGETSQYIAERLRLLIFGDETSNIYSVGKSFPSSSSYQTLIDSEISSGGEPLPVKLQSAQCFAYCEWVYYKLFGAAKWNGGGYTQQSVGVKMTEENIKNALSAAHCGDHVRLANQHSVSFITLDEAGTGFYYLESVNNTSGRYYVRLCHTTFALVTSCYGSKSTISWIQTPQEYPYGDSNAQLSVIDAKIPVNVKTGAGADVIGTTVMSDCNITSVSAGVYSQDGEEKFCVIATPNCGAFRFGKIADNLFTFSALAAGKYTYRLTAVDESGAEVSIEKEFTVSSSATSYTYENASAKSRVSEISVASLPNRTDYFEGDALVPAGFCLSVTFDDGTVTEKHNGFRFSYDFTVTGTVPVTVSYAGLTASFDVNVHPLAGTEIWKVNVTSNLNVRKEPSTTSEKVTSYPNGTLIRITEAVESGGYTWGKTEDGWAAITYCEYISGALYCVSYDANGGASVPFETLKPYGKTVTLAADAAKRDGFMFIGWSTDKSASAAEYQPGDEYSQNSSAVLYAVWKSIETPKIAGTSLSLASDLTLRVFVNDSCFDDGVFTEPYINFELNGRHVTVDEYTVSGDYRIFNFGNISPNEMNDTVYAVLHASHGGEDYTANASELCIADYCINLIGSDRSNEALDRLVVDLLNYGAQSQIYTGHNTDELVTSRLTAAQAALGTQTERNLSSTSNAHFALADGATAFWTGAGLVLNKAIVMKLSFRADSADSVSAVVKDGSGNTVMTVTQFDGSSGSFSFTFDKFTPAQLSDTYYFTLYGADGRAISDTLSYSVESYAVSAQKRAQADETYAPLANLATAIMKYGDSAKAYVG